VRISRRPTVVIALLIGGVGGSPGRALADPVDDPRIQRADALFAEGKALFDSNILQACDKFKESLHENPAAIGTLLNVALCDEKLGRVASAVKRFSEARARAREQGLTEHIRAAEEHIRALEPSVPHLAITLSERLPETRVVIDDAIIAPDALASVAVDPG
jgi:leucyl-tRNA synthetase